MCLITTTQYSSSQETVFAGMFNFARQDFFQAPENSEPVRLTSATQVACIHHVRRSHLLQRRQSRQRIQPPAAPSVTVLIMASFFDEIARNKLKSVLLMAHILALFFIVIFLFVDFLGGGILALIIGGLLVIAYAIFSYFAGI